MALAVAIYAIQKSSRRVIRTLRHLGYLERLEKLAALVTQPYVHLVC